MATIVLIFLAIWLGAVADAQEVNITKLYNAIVQGAVCLDGSPPAYYFDRGFDSGVSNWIIYLQGGGWCESIKDCHYRTFEKAGSSKLMNDQAVFDGILNNNSQHNPDFYNWNRVWVNYCDGSSFTGDVAEVDPENKLYFRGARIFKAVLQDLWSKGLQNAKNAILSGSSAGGLATILNCDKFKSLFSNDSIKVKCVAGAGFFININTISGTPNIQKMFQNVEDLHASVGNLPSSCTSKMDPSLCFFPQHVVSYVKTPLFIFNSAYDAWQINSSLVPPDVDPEHVWDHCKTQISNCTFNQRTIIKGFGVEFMKAFGAVTPSSARGYFITSCHTHPDFIWKKYWFDTSGPKIHNKTLAEAVGDWFFDRTGNHEHMDPYPFAKDCN